ncbi:MAG TPA: glyoxalase [Firmicutes bacterium]|nr:glyoxalase [Bacillota bacterium]
MIMNNFHDSSIHHFTDVTLKVRSLERSLQFYHGLLGLLVTTITDKERWLSADGKTPLIHLIEDKSVVAETRHLGLYHFALLLPSRLTLAQLLLRFNERKYPLSGASNHGVSEAIYLSDPDGNGLEIYIDRDKSEWPVRNGNIDMVSLPLDITDIMCVIKDAPSAGLPQDTRLGHLHLHVASLSTAKHFYQDVLGFQLTLNYGSSALFFGAGGYHHHIGVNTWMPSTRPRRDNEVGLVAYGLSVPDKTALKNSLNHHKIAFHELDGEILFKDFLNQMVIVR